MKYTKEKKPLFRCFILPALLLCLHLPVHLGGQERGLTATGTSPHLRLRSVNIGDVTWTDGFWAERFRVCSGVMVPRMMGCYLNPEVSHAFRNFEIAAGLAEGDHQGPAFHDGDFYKMLEAEIMVWAASRDQKLETEIDRIIAVIGKAQRADGYLHTPALIKAAKNPGSRYEFTRRLDFETYNLGHLMTAACIHHRVTGKNTLLEIARKATRFLVEFSRTAPEELAGNTICPSHYMGVAEMYRTTGDPAFLELAKKLMEIRSLVKEGTDHNQDRIPFKQQTTAVGHAVRANYLYAGAADLYAETGDDSLLTALEKIGNDVVGGKLYITGACGALYDGVSPDGTTYDQPSIQQVHQAYGRSYQLPNLNAHNESCANIGNLLWNWRMLLISGNAAYADIMETVMYNSLLAAVSLDGTGYFYTNPLCVADELSHDLRWSKNREEYISYCNCCPPNTIRTIAEIQEYFYSKSDDGMYVNFYGGSQLHTTWNGKDVSLEQVTGYPWEGSITLLISKFPETAKLYLRIPGWADTATVLINGQSAGIIPEPGRYVQISRAWQTGDRVEVILPMRPVLVEAHPLVEETRNQVAVRRGPVVYCLESPDIPEGSRIFDFSIPVTATLEPFQQFIGDACIVALNGQFLKEKGGTWNNNLYRIRTPEKPEPVSVTLIPYFAWNNRGNSEMTVWIPLDR